ncbi:hypothetical protein LE100_21890, partial [Escherichia coli]|nr:hypothetical protein [Escherichia coli]
MSQDSKVFFRIFLGIGLVLILISVVVFYNQFTYGRCEQVPDMRSSYSSGAHP